MTRIGADPQQLIDAASGFEALADTLESAQHELSGLLTADWWGADGDRFRGAWEAAFRPEMAAQIDAIRKYATATRRQAESQQAASDDRAGAGAGSASGGTRTYRLQDVGTTAKASGSWSASGSGTIGVDPNAPAPPVEPSPPRPGEAGYDEATYTAYVLRQAGLTGAQQVLNGGASVSGSAGGDFKWDAAGAIGDTDLGASGRVGAEAGISASGAADYSYHGAQGQAHADGTFHAGARVFSEFEAHL